MITSRFADFVCSTGFNHLNTETVEAVRRCFLDWLGVALAGSKEETTSILMDLAMRAGGHEQATVIGRGIKCPVIDATLINSVMSHVLDFDDLYHPAHLHVSATLFPPILALLESRHGSGKELISAFVAGFEVEARIGEVAGAALLQRGWHPTACLGPFGAAASAGKIIDLTRDQMIQALGIGATRMAGLAAAFGSMSKALQVGKGAAEGLWAAQLAERGFTGPSDPLGGEKGFLKTYLSMIASEELVSHLGDSYRVVGNSFKLYSSCGASHAAIDAVLALREKHEFIIADITEISCQVWPLALRVCNMPAPETGLDGKFSIPHCVAVAFLDGKAGPAQFKDGRVLSEDVRSLRDKVRVYPKDGFDDRNALVTICTADGNRYEEETVCVRGNPRNPVSWPGLVEKFTGLTRGILEPRKVEAVIDMAKHLEDVEDMCSILSML